MRGGQPHFDFARQRNLLDRIPDWYEGYVVFVDALDPERVASLNPLYIPDDLPDHTIKEMKEESGATLKTKEERELFKKIIEEETGRRLECYPC